MQFEYEESEFYEATQGIDDSYSFQVECGTLEFLWIIQALRRMLLSILFNPWLWLYLLFTHVVSILEKEAKPF